MPPILRRGDHIVTAHTGADESRDDARRRTDVKRAGRSRRSSHGGSARTLVKLGAVQSGRGVGRDELEQLAIERRRAPASVAKGRKISTTASVRPATTSGIDAACRSGSPAHDDRPAELGSRVDRPSAPASACVRRSAAASTPIVASGLSRPALQDRELLGADEVDHDLLDRLDHLVAPDAGMQLVARRVEAREVRVLLLDLAEAILEARAADSRRRRAARAGARAAARGDRGRAQIVELAAQERAARGRSCRRTRAAARSPASSSM